MMTKSTKEIQSSYYGAGLLLLTITVFLIIPVFSDDEIVKYLSYSIYGIIRVGAIFYGQTTIKKLNRNFTNWSAFLFLFPSISLITLGQLEKIKKEMILIELDPSINSKNINNLPALKLGTESNMLRDSLMNEAFTLRHMIINFKNYIKDSTSLFPILAAYQLNKQDVNFDDELKTSLDKFANEKGHDSFYELLNHLKTITPEEIYKTFV